MEDIKKLVQEKYGQIAKQNQEGEKTSCCEPSGCCDSTVDYTNIMSDDYTDLNGYNQEADLGLGCGLPTQFAKIKTGDIVVDLGSGAGNDCFIARAETGEAGQVIGVDFTPEMIEQARKNTQKLGFENVKFIQGDIENIPLGADSVDIVVSNCVFNLVPNKMKAFSETYRILKKGGHFSISDIVLKGELPKGLQEAAEMYAGCVAGAIQKTDYLQIIREAGFTDITIQKEKTIELPDSILDQFLGTEEKEAFLSNKGIYSVTVFAKK